MLCKEIMGLIEIAYPKRYALAWDNVGLLVGRDDKEVRRIYVAVDATDEVIEEAVRYQADLLVTHHPLIFGGMKRINNQDFIGRRVLKLIQNDISCYAMHTNYDVKGMGQLASDKLDLRKAEILEVTSEENTEITDNTDVALNVGTLSSDEDSGILHGMREEGIGRIGELDHAVALREYCERVKYVFSLDTVRVFGNLDTKVRKIAVCPGSGKGEISCALEKKADVLVTGDIGHHEGIDAVAQGMAIIDAGHYGIEHIFVKDMQQYLQKYTEGIMVEGAPICHPFSVL